MVQLNKLLKLIFHVFCHITHALSLNVNVFYFYYFFLQNNNTIYCQRWQYSINTYTYTILQHYIKWSVNLALSPIFLEKKIGIFTTTLTKRNIEHWAFREDHCKWDKSIAYMHPLSLFCGFWWCFFLFFFRILRQSFYVNILFLQLYMYKKQLKSM